MAPTCSHTCHIPTVQQILLPKAELLVPMITQIVHDAVALSMAVSLSPNKHQRIPNAYCIEIIERVWHNIYNMPATIRRRTMVCNQIWSSLAVIVILHCLRIIVIYRRHPAVGIIEILLRPNLTRIVATLNLNTIHKLTVDGNVPRKKQNRTNRKRSSTSSSEQNIEMVFNKV